MWRQVLSVGRSRIQGWAVTRRPALRLVAPRTLCSAATETPVDTGPKETVAGEAKVHGFQAETAQLLQIVAKSLYKDKEVFLRELISNAADACEKRRYLERTGTEGMSSVEHDGISITTDKESGTLTIADSGIGMTESEIHANIGQIASSGTKSFLQAQGTSADLDLIGQFGVGFYSVFMVSDDVQVFTQSAMSQEPAFQWTCEGAGGAYSVAPAENVSVGTKIVIKLNEQSQSFADENFVKDVIQKYSNFVGTKVRLNGEVVNTVEPLWTLDRNKVTKEQHEEFYRYLTKAWDTPSAHLWYAADAPLSVKALFYIPGTNREKFGMGRETPGVNVYCRKILIEAQCEAIIPEWMRFVKGVVDSEDVPLNISRESMQDSALIRQLNKALTARVVKWLADMGKNDPEQYKSVFEEFGVYLKEGVCIDDTNRKALLPLLRFGSSHDAEELQGLDDYVTRMPESQTDIYYMSAPDYKNALASPYYEVFKKKGYEVLLMSQDIDEYMMNQIPEYAGKKLINAEGANLDLAESSSGSLSKEEQDELCGWLKEVLGDQVKDVRPTSRLVDSPCILVNHESATMRKLSKLQNLPFPMGSRQELEVNTDHEILKMLQTVRKDDQNKKMAEQVASQLLNSSLLAAGVVEDSRSMVKELNDLIETCLQTASKP